MKLWSKLSLRKFRQVIYSMKDHWRITVFNWDQKIEIAVSIYFHNLKKKHMISAGGTYRDTKEGHELDAFDQHWGEKERKSLSREFCTAIAWTLLTSLLTFECQSGSGPGPRAKFQIMAGLGEQCRMEHLIPPWLALKWPLNSSSSWACCLKLFLETQMHRRAMPLLLQFWVWVLPHNFFKRIFIFPHTIF